MANGLTGSEPILYKYDLYAFGLILRQLVDVYIDALNKNLLFDPRKYRAKRKSRAKRKYRAKRNSKTLKKGGSSLKTYDYNTRINYNILDSINYIIDNMINQDCIYRWSLNDLISYYEGEEIDTEKYITIKGERYLLCSTDITEENIIRQFQIINPELNVYIKPKDEWDEIKETLTKQGLSKSKIIRTINKMKSKGITSLD